MKVLLSMAKGTSSGYVEICATTHKQPRSTSLDLILRATPMANMLMRKAMAASAKEEEMNKATNNATKLPGRRIRC